MIILFWCRFERNGRNLIWRGSTVPVSLAFQIPIKAVEIHLQLVWFLNMPFKSLMCLYLPWWSCNCVLSQRPIAITRACMIVGWLAERNKGLVFKELDTPGAWSLGVILKHDCYKFLNMFCCRQCQEWLWNWESCYLLITQEQIRIKCLRTLKMWQFLLGHWQILRNSQA